MDLALLCLDVVTIAAVLLIGSRVLASYPRQLQAWLAFMLCIAVAAHVALARAEYGAWAPLPYRFDFGAAAPVLDVVRNMAPALFALVAWMVFADHRRIPAWLGGLSLLQLGVEIAPHLPGPDDVFDPASALLHLVFSAAAVVWTVAYWRVDLIEARRRTRAVVAMVLVVDGVATSILLRLVIPGEAYASYLVHLVLTAITGAIAVFVVARMMGGDLAPYLGRGARLGRAASEARGREDDRALARLERLLEVDQVHLEPGLSLARLAARVGTPEYRLRRLIHERMGYRNFNVFLHAYRIKAAAEQLADPARRRTPILTIALSCGYESSNTFNRGFRELMGLNPSDYRTQQLASAQAAPASPDSA